MWNHTNNANQEVNVIAITSTSSLKPALNSYYKFSAFSAVFLDFVCEFLRIRKLFLRQLVCNSIEKSGEKTPHDFFQKLRKPRRAFGY